MWYHRGRHGIRAVIHAVPSPLSRRRLAWWLLWASLAVHVPIALIAAKRSTQPHDDIDNYYNIATRPGRPYLDFPVEFPVGTVITFRTLGALAGGRQPFGISIVIVNAMADAAIAAALAYGWGVTAAACYVFTAIPIVDLFFLRMDLWSTAAATIAVAFWRRDRRILAACGLAAGAGLKLWPLALSPLLLAPSPSRSRTAPLAAAVAAGAVVLGGWLWVAGPSGLYQVLTFRGAQGWQIESTVGSIWMLFDQSSMRVEAGAWRIGVTKGPISVLLFALAAPLTLWIVWRGARTGHLGAGWAGGISALLLFSALLSPQFSAWLTPATGIAWAEKDRRTAALTALAVFFSNLIWKSANPLVHGSFRALAILLARNVLLAALAVYTARLVARAPIRSRSLNEPQERAAR
jgi:hypothetical protein